MIELNRTCKYWSGRQDSNLRPFAPHVKGGRVLAAYRQISPADGCDNALYGRAENLLSIKSGCQPRLALRRDQRSANRTLSSLSSAAGFRYQNDHCSNRFLDRFFPPRAQNY
jgi:hypothetical protein